MIAARLAAAVMVALIAQPAGAYLKFGVPVDGRVVIVKWARPPVQYFVNDRGVPGVSATAFADAVARAFATWEEVPTAAIRYEFGGYTAAAPDEDDGRTTLGFIAAPELERVLASTSLLIDEVTGQIVEADIFFNSTFQWSAATAAQPGRFDLETTALHEIGHLNGLGHSAIGETEVSGTGRRVLSAEAVMFPLSFGSGTAHRALRADDVAGVSALYPDGDFEATRGSISGRVTKNGRGLFGAHVVAFNPGTGALVGNFALNANGNFTIEGLPAGPHVLRVEPLDDADVDSFFEIEPPIDLDFRALFHPRLIVVPRGGGGPSVEIQATPK